MGDISQNRGTTSNAPELIERDTIVSGTNNNVRGEADAYLAAVIESSDDAIISKNLDGIITGWNKSAERIFGYSAREAIGKSILMIIPPDRVNEEKEILARIRSGQR